MNTIVTSRKQLLEAAKQIAVEQGISGISIRAVAQKSGVSIGSIYHYFTSKAELVVAVIEDFWQAAFQGTDWQRLGCVDFITCFTTIYQAVETDLVSFHEEWLSQAARLKEEEKALGKKKEADYLEQIRRTLLESLKNDPALFSFEWKEPVTRERFVELAFSSMLMQLRNQAGCDTLVEVLKGYLYR